jgi:urate oxidase/2-oxo-4-hydroxy-4-carboxy-5-ureidoimidazoline decarboxylase
MTDKRVTEKWVNEDSGLGQRAHITSIDYGKAGISTYRFAAKPLTVPAIPESPFTGRGNELFAVDVDVQVLGGPFSAAYTEGDNHNVVATDTMKNFVLKRALEFEGSTLEAFLDFLGRAFLATYPDMPAIHVTGREFPFAPAPVPSGDTFVPSTVLFSRTRGDYGAAELILERTSSGVALTDHECGRLELQLVKTTGSSFAAFARDSHTTLPEVQDRPLFIYLDMFWRYRDPAQMVADTPDGYVPAEQVRDLAALVFHEFNSKSIQHLVYEMGTRILGRFPQLAEVRFEAQNRLWDPAFTTDDPAVFVRTDPRPPYGRIGLTLSADDMTEG